MELGSSGVGEAEARRPRDTRGLCPHSGRGHEHLEKELGRRLLPKLRWGGPRPRVVVGGAGVGSSVLGEDTEAGNGGACARKRKPSASCRGRNDLGLWGHARGDKPQGHCP